MSQLKNKIFRHVFKLNYKARPSQKEGLVFFDGLYYALYIMKSISFSSVYKEYRFMILSGIAALFLIGLVFVFIRNEIDRFTFIMPIFASWILAAILFDLPDEEEGNEN